MVLGGRTRTATMMAQPLAPEPAAAPASARATVLLLLVLRLRPPGALSDMEMLLQLLAADARLEMLGALLVLRTRRRASILCVMLEWPSDVSAARV